jgi:hypothetical protein
MYRIILLFILIPCSLIAFGQKMTDVLYLKDGSIIKGKIVDTSDATVRIETCCGSLFVYQNAKILRLDKEHDLLETKQVKRIGYMNFSSFGVLLGSTANPKQAPLSLLSEHNYRINKNFSAGIVLGYELLNEATIPLATNVKLMLPLKKSDLFLGLSGGYNFSVENPEPGFYQSYTGGIMFNIEVGTIIPLSQNNALLVAMGYRYNELHYKYEYWWAETVDRTYYYNRISIRLGMVMY